MEDVQNLNFFTFNNHFPKKGVLQLIWGHHITPGAAWPTSRTQFYVTSGWQARWAQQRTGSRCARDGAQLYLFKGGYLQQPLRVVHLLWRPVCPPEVSSMRPEELVSLWHTGWNPASPVSLFHLVSLPSRRKGFIPIISSYMFSVVSGSL